MKVQLNSSKSTSDKTQDRSEDDPNDQAKFTFDEKFNAVLKIVACVILQSFTLQAHNAAIILSGANSKFVKEIRKKYGSRRSNFECASLPFSERALTVGRADCMSLYFSPDSACIGVLYFAGTSLKVGHSTIERKGKHDLDGRPVSELEENLQYDWHTIAHPFDLVTKVGGIIPIIIWAVSYDHHWNTRLIRATLTSSEITVSLSPEHIHTAFLHLDDYTDVNSAGNEWIQWLISNHRESLKTDENEKLAYCETYAKVKCRKKGVGKAHVAV